MSVWQPLDPYKKEIRVLVVAPGASADKLMCDLEIVSLDAEPEYQALSYVWGPPPSSCEVCLEGTQHKVTDNLFDALMEIRHDQTTQKIWVDAVCIDQKNEKEREAQVMMMGEIYTRASLVHVWLGRLENFMTSLIEDVSHQVRQLVVQSVDLSGNDLENYMSSMQKHLFSADACCSEALKRGVQGTSVVSLVSGVEQLGELLGMRRKKVDP
ncbi:hypothetical protein ACN47E_000770 [Coniothyrium glycines]